MKRTLLIVGLIAGLALIVAACAPAVAPVEAPVAATSVVAPTEVPPAEVPPAPTEDPSVAITAEFTASGHADGAAEAFTHWDEGSEIPVACVKCHSETGFIEYITAGTNAAGVPVPGKAFTCATCHNDGAKALTSVTFPSGVVIENLGAEARCLTCHQGRESKVSLDAKLAKYGEELDPDAVPAPLPADPNKADSKPTPLSFSNVHYFAAGGTLYGSQVKMGYEYDGKLYDVKNSHVTGIDTCIGCHDQHSLEVKVEVCSECHQGVASVEDLRNVREPSSSKDYDGDGDKTEGVAKEIEGLQAILLTSIQNYGLEVGGAEIKYDGATYPYFMGADGKSYTSWTPRLLKAAYNYQVSVKDPGAFAHGGKYIIELLFDSIEDLNSSEKLTTKFDATTLTREDSGHFNGAVEPWRHWDATEGAPYEVPAGCAKCHSAAGVPQVVKSEEVTSAKAGNGLMCETCHDVTAFPAVFSQKEVTLSSGKAVTFGDGDPSNVCLNCHSARTGKVSVDKKITDFGVTDLDVVVEPMTKDGKEVKFSFINAHYQGIAGMWFGTDALVAYEYEGKTYVGTNKHPAINGKSGCVGCHDAHNGEIDLAVCTTCHAGVEDVDNIRMYPTDWNGNGDTTENLRAEYNLIRDAMYAAIQAYAKDTVKTGIIYDREVYPYWFADADNNDEIDQVDGKSVTYSTWTGRLLKAAYNFNWLRKTSGGFAHNFKYITQIAIDTIEDLGGDVTMYTRP